MAKYRQVNTFFWDDPYIEDLCPLGKLLFLYLITTPLTNVAGSFEITLKRMHEQTGIPRDTISDLLKRFEADGKCIYRGNWMLVVNTIEHQHWQTHATVRKGIENVVSASPDWVKDRLCIAYDWLSHLNLNSNLNLNSKEGVETPPVAALAAVDTSPETDKAPESDPVERRIWTDGVEMLARSNVKPEKARPLLGRLAKEHGKITLAQAIAATQAENPADPKTYLIGVLRQRAADRSKTAVGKWDGVERPPEAAACPRCGSDVCLGGEACEQRAAVKMAA